MDGTNYVLISFNKGHKGHHHTHGAGQSLLRAIARVDRLSSFTQDKHMFSVASPCLAGHVFLLSSAPWRNLLFVLLSDGFLSHEHLKVIFGLS